MDKLKIPTISANGKNKIEGVCPYFGKEKILPQTGSALLLNRAAFQAPHEKPINTRY